MNPFRTSAVLVAIIAVVCGVTRAYPDEGVRPPSPDPQAALVAMGPPGIIGDVPGAPRPGGGPGFLPPPMPGGPGGPGAWWRDPQIVQRLGLSDDQVRQIEATVFQHRVQLVDLRADLEKQELGLQPLLEADAPDEAKVAGQLDRITAARGRLEKAQVLMLLATRRVLTPEQRKQLQALQREHRPPRGPAGPGFGPGMPGPGAGGPPPR